MLCCSVETRHLCRCTADPSSSLCASLRLRFHTFPPTLSHPQVLSRAVSTHQRELSELLAGRPRPLTLIINTEDFPIMFRGLRCARQPYQPHFTLVWGDERAGQGVHRGRAELRKKK
eukprot:353620-Chlamydomonas_euryale.AAC.7